MISAEQINLLTPILAAQGFRWENSYATKAIFTNGRHPEIYWLTIYLQTEKPVAEVRRDDELCRTIEAEDYGDFEGKIKAGVI
jgi:hypothetical protein